MITLDRFMARVSPEPMSGCWLWTGGMQSQGYGSLWTGERRAYAHRVAWELTHGPIPDGLFVLHHCDNRACVNAEGGHLFLGTLQDNVRDMVAKGRNYSPPRGRWSDKTHCAHGHEFTPSNTATTCRGYRACRACLKAQRAREAKKPGTIARMAVARQKYVLKKQVEAIVGVLAKAGDTPHLSVAEMKARWACSISTVRWHAKMMQHLGLYRYVQLGRTHRVSLDAIRAYEAERARTGPADCAVVRSAATRCTTEARR